MSVTHQDWNTIYVNLDKYKKEKKNTKDNTTKGPSNSLDKTDIDTFKNKKIDEKLSVKIRNARNVIGKNDAITMRTCAFSCHRNHTQLMATIGITRNAIE